ncbi:MAG: carboxypeptidase regulatory-like domain-containing protein [Acidobacteriaceae bacterium]
MTLRKAASFIWIFSSIASVAQTAVDGAIGGNVKDRSGAFIRGATVTIHSNSTDAAQTITTDDSGFFRAIHLQPGMYTVDVAAPGFEASKSNQVVVSVGSLTDLEPTLAPGSSTETIEVSGAAPAINTINNDFTTTIGSKVLEDLPVNNYRWSAYALQAPAVVESGGFGLLSFRGQSTLLNNITIDGADDNQAFFSEERGRTNVGYSTPKSAIQEFQINTSNYSTEYGRAAGGVVNSVTKSGGNKFHGEGYFLDRDSALAAFNNYTEETVQTVPGGPFVSTHVKPTDIRKQEGFAVGGPLIHDKLFFFFALDRFYHDFPIVTVPSSPANFFARPSATLPAGKTCPGAGATAPITATNDSNFFADSSACTLQSQLNLPTYSAGVTDYINGQAGLSALLGPAARFADQTLFFPKVDWQINERNHLSGEANRLRFISPSGQQTNATAQYGTQSIGNVYARDTWGVARLDTSITPTLTNEVRYQYGRDFEFAGPETPTTYENNTLLQPPGYGNPFGIPPNVFITGAFQFGTPSFYPRPAYPDERRWQISDTANYVRGNHNIKFGIDYIHTNDLSENISNYYGAYSYTSVANYLTDYYQSQNPATAGLTGHYSTYNQGFGPLGFEFQTGDYAGFIQDEWKVRPRLSLTIGLRYEFERTPNAQLPNPNIPQTESFPSDKNNIAPRVGFAFDVYGNGKTVLRGGYGIFNARLINSTIYNALAQTGSPNSQFQTPNYTPATNGAPRFPQILSTSAGVTPNVIYFDPHFQLPQIHQADLAVEQDVGWNTVLSISWLGSFGRELPNFIDTNLPAPVGVTYTVVNNNPSAFAGLPNQAQYTANLYGYAVSSTGKTAPGEKLRPNSSYGSITDIVSNINTSYNALVVQVQHRISHNIQFQSSYTWSHALDYNENNTTFSNSSSVLDPRNFHLEYGNSNQNIPNRFIATAIIDSPWKASGWKSYLVDGYQLSPSFSAQNGDDYSASITGNPTALVTSGFSTGYATGVSSGYTGTGGSSRIPGLERNTFQQPRTILLDLRGSKHFTVRERYNLEFLAEAFNLANHQNVTAVNTTAYTLGTTTANGVTTNTLTQYLATPFSAATNSNNNNIYSPRQIQLGVRLQF